MNPKAKNTPLSTAKGDHESTWACVQICVGLNAYEIDMHQPISFVSNPFQYDLSQKVNASTEDPVSIFFNNPSMTIQASI